MRCRASPFTAFCRLNLALASLEPGSRPAMGNLESCPYTESTMTDNSGLVQLRSSRFDFTVIYSLFRA